MNRRQFLTSVGTASILSGCLSGAESGTTTPAGDKTRTPVPDTPEDAAVGENTPDRKRTAGDSGDSADEPTERSENLAAFGTPATICEESIRTGHGIYAVLEPTFASDWSAHRIDGAYRYDPESAGLADEQTIIGLERDGNARAYPLTILNVHEIVNDTFGGPVVITFCPICRSGMVADRRVEGDVTQFAVTGLLWRPERIHTEASKKENRTFGASATGGDETEVRNNGNLVMYDAATRSYWSQVLARSICGPLAGTELDIVPSTVASWGEWRADHPDTEVLLPPPHSKTVSPDQILGSKRETPTTG